MTQQAALITCSCLRHNLLNPANGTLLSRDSPWYLMGLRQLNLAVGCVKHSLHNRLWRCGALGWNHSFSQDAKSGAASSQQTSSQARLSCSLAARAAVASCRPGQHALQCHAPTPPNGV